MATQFPFSLTIEDPFIDSNELRFISSIIRTRTTSTTKAIVWCEDTFGIDSELDLWILRTSSPDIRNRWIRTYSFKHESDYILFCLKFSHAKI